MPCTVSKHGASPGCRAASPPISEAALDGHSATSAIFCGSRDPRWRAAASAVSRRSGRSQRRGTPDCGRELVGDVARTRRRGPGRQRPRNAAARRAAPSTRKSLRPKFMSRFVRSGRLCAPKPPRMPRVFPPEPKWMPCFDVQRSWMRFRLRSPGRSPRRTRPRVHLSAGPRSGPAGLFGSADASSASPAFVAGRLAALDEYYVQLDALLGPAVSLSDDALLIVIASPGRVPSPGQECCSSAAPPQTCACATATRGPPM